MAICHICLGSANAASVDDCIVLQTLLWGVSHLLHMAFFPGLYDSRGQLCLVNPTMQSRTCLQLAVLPHWAESRSCAWQVCKVACLSSHRAAILSVTYPGVPAVTEQICAAAHICSYAESMNMRS